MEGHAGDNGDYTDLIDLRVSRDLTAFKGDRVIINKRTGEIVYVVSRTSDAWSSDVRPPEPVSSSSRPADKPKPARKPRAHPRDHTEAILTVLQNADPAHPLHISQIGKAIGTTAGVASHWCSRLEKLDLVLRDQRGWYKPAPVPSKTNAAAEWSSTVHH